jgi:serine/threonine-protein kinase
LLDAGADSVPFLQRVQREHPGDFWANLALSRAILEKNPGESIRYFQAALAIRPRTAVVNDGLGLALLVTGRSDEAIDHFREALRIDPEFANAHNSLGFALQSRGRRDEAIAHYQHALCTDPLRAEVHTNLSSALIAQGRHDEAIEHVREAIRIDPRSSEAHVQLCTVLKARGGPQAVIAHYRQMLRADPELAPAHAYLGIALAEAGQADEAIDHLRKALRIDPKLSVAHYHLAMALSSLGPLDEAVDHLQQFVTLNPRMPQAHGALGQTLLGLGRFRDARDATQRHLDLLPPDHPERPKVVQRLRLCEDLLVLEARLPAVLRGEDRPGDAAERLRFAEVCRVKKRYADAARLSEKAFADKPQLADDVQASYRYNAARAAALAGCGQGEDGDKLGTEERARWRRQARAWLQADLAVMASKLDGGTAAGRAQVRTRLTHWRANPDLAGLREPAVLGRMSANEREECVALWKEVNALLNRAGQIK